MGDALDESEGLGMGEEDLVDASLISFLKLGVETSRADDKRKQREKRMARMAGASRMQPHLAIPCFSHDPAYSESLDHSQGYNPDTEDGVREPPERHQRVGCWPAPSRAMVSTTSERQQR